MGSGKRYEKCEFRPSVLENVPPSFAPRKKLFAEGEVWALREKGGGEGRVWFLRGSPKGFGALGLQ